MLRRLIPLLSVLALTGSCATLDEGQCRAGDWGAIGFDDGAQGYAMDRLDQHAKACEKYGVSPDPAAYSSARAQGLRRYCTPESGFHAARQGRAYANVCPADLERAFLGGYGDGQLVHGAQQRLDQARSDRASAINRADNLEKQIAADEAKLADAATPDKDKGAIRERLKRLRDDRKRALDDAPRYERIEREEARELDRLRASFTGAYGGF